MKKKFYLYFEKRIKKALSVLGAVATTLVAISVTGISAFANVVVPPKDVQDAIINFGGSESSEEMDTETKFIIGIIVMLVVVFIIAFFSYKKMKNNLNNVYGEGQGGYETQKVSAKVISKTTTSHSVYRIQINYLTFEFKNGERREFAIRDESAFRSIVENDKGILTYCGKAFISFKRE